MFLAKNLKTENDDNECPLNIEQMPNKKLTEISHFTSFCEKTFTTASNF